MAAPRERISVGCTVWARATSITKASGQCLPGHGEWLQGKVDGADSKGHWLATFVGVQGSLGSCSTIRLQLQRGALRLNAPPTLAAAPAAAGGAAAAATAGGEKRGVEDEDSPVSNKKARADETTCAQLCLSAACAG
eukprot:SAG22_NODE_1844_length_3454_cov_2.054844_2_plen_137_part_00